ncbi:MAG: hypothetical protein JEZ00_11595 [Anaerolineaceae bacterium]|nr:hypothetical protein [Anaerolineaceae bacterium]
MDRHTQLPKKTLLITILLILILLLSGCAAKDKNVAYQHADIYLNCENYSETENDPGNCMVISGTTDGLRIKIGMIVSKNYVTSLMKDLGWKKESQTSKYVDSSGSSFRVEVYKFSRELK